MAGILLSPAPESGYRLSYPELGSAELPVRAG